MREQRSAATTRRSARVAGLAVDAAASARSHARSRRHAAAQSAAARRERRPRRRRHSLLGVVRDARHGAGAKAGARSDDLCGRQGHADGVARELRQVAAVDLSARRRQRAQLLPRLPVDSAAPVLDDRGAARRHPHLLRSVRGAREVPALAGLVVGDGARGRLADREEAAADSSRHRALSHPRHRQGPQAVHLDVHRPRAGGERERLAVPRLAHRRHLRHRHRHGRPAAGQSGAHLRRRDAGLVSGYFAGSGHSHPRDPADGEAGERAVLPALRRRRAARRPERVHGHRRRASSAASVSRRKPTRRSRPKRT